MVETWQSIVQVTQQSCTNEFHECWHTHIQSLFISVSWCQFFISSSLHSFQSCLICKKKLQSVNINTQIYSRREQVLLHFCGKCFLFASFCWVGLLAIDQSTLPLETSPSSWSKAVLVKALGSCRRVARVHCWLQFPSTWHHDSTFMSSRLQPLPAAMETSSHAHAYLTFELWGCTLTVLRGD